MYWKKICGRYYLQLCPRQAHRRHSGQVVREVLSNIKWLGLFVTVVLLVSTSGSFGIAASAPTQTGGARILVQDKNPSNGTGQRIKFERISLEQGLSQSSVFCILQDSKGFMWFGTQDGLNKYDGYGFKVYKPNPGSPNSLTHRFIWSIYEDQEGALWIGTDGEGLDRFDPSTEQLVNYRNNPNDIFSLLGNYVFSIYQDREGILWVGTDAGLNKYDREKDQFTRYQHDNGKPESLGRGIVWSIYEDREGILWIGTAGGGLNRFDRSMDSFIQYQYDPGDPYSLSSNSVRSIYEDWEGVLWVGTDGGGLNRFDRSTDRFIHYKHNPDDSHSLGNDSVRAIHEDQSGALWIGTGGGLDRLVLDQTEGFDPEDVQFIHHQNDFGDPDSISSDNVMSIYEDREGVLWIGTSSGGINKLNVGKRDLLHYENDPGDPRSLSDDMVYAIYEDHLGDLWVGTIGGLNRLDRETGQFALYQSKAGDPYSLNGSFILSVFEDRSGALWIGTANGLDRFDRETERFIHYLNDPSNPGSLSDNFVRTIYEDRSGTLWVGTDGGLNRFDRDTEQFKHYHSRSGNPFSLSSDQIRVIYEDQLGVLWVGTADGLNTLDRKNGLVTRYYYDSNDPNSMSDDFILSIYEDRSGVLWVGTFQGGLNKFVRETESFVHYRENDGLPNDVVYGILEDSHGNLWLSTNKGLSKFDPETETFRNYDVRDGLQSNEYNSGAYHKSGEGEMFFGGIHGFDAFYPDNIKDNPYVPPVVLTSFKQGGEEIDFGQAVENVTELSLRWPNNYFEFDYSALSYYQPEKNQYRYMLEGFDKDWNPKSTRRFGKYTNLPGGTYTLRIIGSNNDGVWNEEGVSVNITIVPPFWKTWWFRGIFVLVLVGGGITFYRLRVKSIEARNRELQTLVEERTYALGQRTYELEERAHELERRRQVAEGLREILVILNSDRSLEESLDYIVHQPALLSGAEGAIVFRREKTGPSTIIAASIGLQNINLEGENLPAPAVEWITQTFLKGQSLILPDLESYRVADPGLATPTLSKYRAILGIPLTIGGEIYGGLVLFYTQTQTFSEQDLQLGFTFADQAALAIANAQLRDRAEHMAVAAERNRLARDLHDAVTQTLFSASLIAEVLPRLWERNFEEGQRRLEELRELTRGALAEMRTLLLELRPSSLVEAELGDLLRQLAESITGRARVPVDVQMEGDCDLPPEVKVALYRIAQEALNNVAKHAGASHASVSVQCHPGQVDLSIIDDGSGFDPESVSLESLGIGIMTERVDAIGATLKIESQNNHGTEIMVAWKEPRGELQ